MDKNSLKEIIIEQQRIFLQMDLGIKRDCLNQFSKYIKNPYIVVISGLRRCGKSTLLLQIMNNFFKEPIFYFNFEDERLMYFTSEDFNNLLELSIELFGQTKTYFFDEIQNIIGWEMFVRRLQDSGNKIFITGSNASLLSKELGTRLTGRYIPVELYPFSFKEYLYFKGLSLKKDSLSVTSERAKIKRRFNEYLKNGGLPEYIKYKQRNTLSTLYNDIIYRDIAARYDIKEVKSLKDLTIYLLSNAGTLVSYNRLKNMLGLGSVNTPKKFLEYLENTYLIATVPRYSHSIRQQIRNPKKVFGVDNGILNFASFRFSENKGKFLENLVFIELKRRKQEVYYYKTKKGKEVDFLLREGIRHKELVQVTQSLGRKEVRDRELNALAEAMDELKIKPGLILTEDEEEDLSIGNKKIKIMPVYKWLLRGPMLSQELGQQKTLLR